MGQKDSPPQTWEISVMVSPLKELEIAVLEPTERVLYIPARTLQRIRGEVCNRCSKATQKKQPMKKK